MMNKQENTPFESDADIKKTIIEFLVSASNRLRSDTADFISDSSDVEAVHQMRLEIRKIRSLLFFIKTLINNDCYESLNGKLKQLNKSLAAMRDLDILILNCNRFNESNRLTGIIQAERTDLSDSLRTELSNPDEKQKVLAIDWTTAIEWNDSTRLEETVPDYVRSELSRMLKKYLKLGKSTDFSMPDQLHKFRIAGKKIKTILELFLPILDKKEQKLYRSLKKLLQTIGDIHDFQTSRSILLELSNKNAVPSDEVRKSVEYFKKKEKKKAKSLDADWHRAKKGIKTCLKTR